MLDYITTSNVYWGKFELTDVKQMAFGESEREKCTAKYGDLLVCEGGDIGRAAIWNYDYPICIQNHLHRLRSYIPLCTKYFLYSLMYSKITGNIKGKGIGLMSLSSNDLHNITVALPPLAEQYRIVNAVDRLFSLIETIECSRNELYNTIAQLQKTILSCAIHGRLVPQNPEDEPASELLKRINPKTEITCDNAHYPQLPKSWCLVQLQDLCSLYDGEKRSNHILPYIDVKYLRGGKSAEMVASGKFVKKGSLLILVDGENSGEVFLSSCDGYQGSTFKQLKINNNVYEEYVLLVIQMSRKMLRENKVGSAIPHLDKKIFRTIQVCLPPYQEQIRIVEEVAKLNLLLDTILESL